MCFLFLSAESFEANLAHVVFRFSDRQKSGSANALGDFFARFPNFAVLFQRDFLKVRLSN